MHTALRLGVLTASVSASLVLVTTPASASTGQAVSSDEGLIACTLGYPNTLLTNPYDPTDFEVFPTIRTGGLGDYVLRIGSSTIGYANCVL